MPEDAPEVVQDLIKRLLLKDPSKRLGADDIDNLGRHEFFEGVHFETMYSQDAPLLDKQKKLSLQQQKELKFLPRDANSQLKIATRVTRVRQTCFADRVKDQVSASLAESVQSSMPIKKPSLLCGQEVSLSKSKLSKSTASITPSLSLGQEEDKSQETPLRGVEPAIKVETSIDTKMETTI